MVLIHDKSKYIIKAIIEPERRYNCLLKSFGCGLSYFCKECKFAGDCDLCPEIQNQEILLDPDQTTNVVTEACFRITTNVIEIKEEKIEYFCFFFPVLVEKERKLEKTFNKNITYIKCKQADVVELYVSEGQWKVMRKEASTYGDEMSNKKKKIKYDIENKKNEMTPDVVGCGCNPKKSKMKKSYSIIMEPNENYDEEEEL